MNRFHVHLNVSDLDASVRFYTELFAASPTVKKHDYAKWMLDDPRINFAISNAGRAQGIDHLGIQVDSDDALQQLAERLAAAGQTVLAEPDATCCYAKSDKFWTEDPQGTRWETFHTFGEATADRGASAACANEGESCAPAGHAPGSRTAGPVACCGSHASCC